MRHDKILSKKDIKALIKGLKEMEKQSQIPNEDLIPKETKAMGLKEEFEEYWDKNNFDKELWSPSEQGGGDFVKNKAEGWLASIDKQIQEGKHEDYMDRGKVDENYLLISQHKQVLKGYIKKSDYNEKEKLLIELNALKNVQKVCREKQMNRPSILNEIIGEKGDKLNALEIKESKK